MSLAGEHSDSGGQKGQNTEKYYAKELSKHL